jgi:hypothetical protein
MADKVRPHCWSGGELYLPEITQVRPERKPATLLQADVMSKSGVPSPSTSPMPVASNPSVSPGTRPVMARSNEPSFPL